MSDILRSMRPPTIAWCGLASGQEDAARLDRRLVAMDADGEVRTIVPDSFIATLWRAVQEQQAQIEELKRRVH
jgi:hypothetical protein